MLISCCTQLRTEFYRDETAHLYKVGCNHYAQGDYAAARDVFEKLLVLDPDYGPAYVSLGNLAMIDGRYELACDYYARAVARDPELEKDVQPFLAVSMLHRQRIPLVDRGIELANVYPLLMAEKNDDIEELLAGDIPLELLANDSATVTPGQLGEMRGVAARLAQDQDISVKFRLFLAYLLLAGGRQRKGGYGVACPDAADRRRQGKNRRPAWQWGGCSSSRKETVPRPYGTI